MLILPLFIKQHIQKRISEHLREPLLKICLRYLSFTLAFTQSIGPKSPITVLRPLYAAPRRVDPLRRTAELHSTWSNREAGRPLF